MQADSFVAGVVKELAQDDDDVVADEGAVLFGRAFGEANGEAVDEMLLQLFVRCAGFPERLHAVAGRNEAFVLRHGEQGRDGFWHLAVWVAFGEIAKDLGSDGAAAIVFVSERVGE